MSQKRDRRSKDNTDRDTETRDVEIRGEKTVTVKPEETQLPRGSANDCAVNNVVCGLPTIFEDEGDSVHEEVVQQATQCLHDASERQWMEFSSEHAAFVEYMNVLFVDKMSVDSRKQLREEWARQRETGPGFKRVHAAYAVRLRDLLHNWQSELHAEFLKAKRDSVEATWAALAPARV